MTNNLRAAGIRNSVLEQIPDIIKSCRECRIWATPAPATQQSVTLPERFGQHVESDLLFYKDHIIFHSICRAVRWHAGKVVSSKQEQELLDALYSTWISIHGPMEYWYIDGESGLNTERVRATLARDGIQLKTRAPGQHARFIERRGAVLRVCMHQSESQAEREGVDISVDHLLATSIFAGHTLTTVGAATPYQAV